MIKSLQRLQIRAIGVIANNPYDYSSTSMQKELGCPSIKDSYLRTQALRHLMLSSMVLDLLI